MGDVISWGSPRVLGILGLVLVELVSVVLTSSSMVSLLMELSWLWDFVSSRYRLRVLPVMDA